MVGNGIIIFELSVICYLSEAVKPEVQSKQKGYATHKETKQAFKDQGPINRKGTHPPSLFSGLCVVILLEYFINFKLGSIP